MKKVAIIGAGLSSLALADDIADIAEVTIFEKHHQIGGRMATKEYLPFEFDHGAQFFKVKNPEFSVFVDRLKKAGVVDCWTANFVEIDGNQVIKSRIWDEDFPHYVGIPNMSSVGHFMYGELLNRDVKIFLNKRITRVCKRNNASWCLKDDHNELGTYDWVITAIPAEQTLSLMPSTFMHTDTIKKIDMQPCFALLMGYDYVADLFWDVAHIANSNLSWISVNSTKPERKPYTTIVAMSRNNWAEAHFNRTEAWVIHSLRESVDSVLGKQLTQPNLVHLKKWHYANARKLGQEKVLIDPLQHLASCGDWCISGRVESAYLSGKKLGRELKQYI
jgi:renalase